VLGQLTGQQETDSSLDLPAGDGGALVVVGQAGRLGSNALEDVVHERVHDGHGLAADSGVGVDLLQHLVDVDGVALLPPALLLLVSLGDVLLGLAGFFRCLAACLRCHGVSIGGVLMESDVLRCTHTSQRNLRYSLYLSMSKVT